MTFDRLSRAEMSHGRFAMIAVLVVVLIELFKI